MVLHVNDRYVLMMRELNNLTGFIEQDSSKNLSLLLEICLSKTYYVCELNSSGELMAWMGNQERTTPLDVVRNDIHEVNVGDVSKSLCYAVELKECIGIISRSEYLTGNYRINVISPQFTEGNSISQSEPTNDLRKLVTKLIKENGTVYEFQDMAEMISWLNVKLNNKK
jgi:hypothetical protein